MALPFIFRAPGRAHLLGGASPLYTRQGEVLAGRQGYHREMLAEGSRRQNAGLTNKYLVRDILILSGPVDT